MSITGDKLREITNQNIEDSLSAVFKQMEELANNGKSELVLNSDVLSDIQYERLIELGLNMRNNQAMGEDTIRW